VFADDFSNLVLATFHRLSYLTDRLLVIPLDGFTQATPYGASEIIELILKKPDLVPTRLNDTSGGKTPPEGIHVLGVGILALSSVAWAAGSIYARNANVSPSPLMTSAMQMFFGGALLLLAGILNGDLRLLSLDTVSLRSVLAFLYLTFFGSIVAFTAYSWLVKATSPSRAITSSYVNPVVAILLGWALAGEPLTYQMMVAMLIILLAVAVITTAKKPAKTT